MNNNNADVTALENKKMKTIKNKDKDIIEKIEAKVCKVAQKYVLEEPAIEEIKMNNIDCFYNEIAHRLKKNKEGFISAIETENQYRAEFLFDNVIGYSLNAFKHAYENSGENKSERRKFFYIGQEIGFAHFKLAIDTYKKEVAARKILKDEVGEFENSVCEIAAESMKKRSHNIEDEMLFGIFKSETAFMSDSLVEDTLEKGTSVPAEILDKTLDNSLKAFESAYKNDGIEFISMGRKNGTKYFKAVLNTYKDLQEKSLTKKI